jgi:hypothetical protein
MQLEGSSYNVLRNNNMANNAYNFGVGGHALLDFVNDVDCSNTVDSKPSARSAGSSNSNLHSDSYLPCKKKK